MSGGNGRVEQDGSNNLASLGLSVVETTNENHDCGVEEGSPDDGVSSTELFQEVRCGDTENATETEESQGNARDGAEGDTSLRTAP